MTTSSSPPLAPQHAERPRTLFERLTRVFDRSQTILTRKGLIPWRVTIIVYKWDGGAVFRGQPRIFKKLELTPPPDVLGEGNLRATMDDAGLYKQGRVKLQNISARYTQDELDILFGAVAADEERFVEIMHDTRDGRHPTRQLFVPIGQPERDVGGGAWSLMLNKSVNDRTRDGRRRPWSDE